MALLKRRIKTGCVRVCHPRFLPPLNSVADQQEKQEERRKVRKRRIRERNRTEEDKSKLRFRPRLNSLRERSRKWDPQTFV